MQTAESEHRQWQRRGYFFEALLTVCGGSLVGRRVLDLGCGAGFWSLQAVEAGAEFVLGVDGREMYVEQAGLVFEAKGVERSRYRFERANIFEHGFDEHYDIVLCVEAMHRVAKPIELFEVFARVGAELVVIDTGVSFAPGGFFELARERAGDDGRSRASGPDPLGEPHDHGQPAMALVPSRQAVADLASQFGFDTVALAHDMGDYTGLEDYRVQRRLAFVCAKGMALDGLTPETPPPATPGWVGLLNPARRGWLRSRR